MEQGKQQGKCAELEEGSVQSESISRVRSTEGLHPGWMVRARLSHWLVQT